MESLSARLCTVFDAFGGGVKARIGRRALGGYSKRKRFLFISTSESFVKGTVVWDVAEGNI
jgi:hypothetical protein